MTPIPRSFSDRIDPAERLADRPLGGGLDRVLPPVADRRIEVRPERLALRARSGVGDADDDHSLELVVREVDPLGDPTAGDAEQDPAAGFLLEPLDRPPQVAHREAAALDDGVRREGARESRGKDAVQEVEAREEDGRLDREALEDLGEPVGDPADRRRVRLQLLGTAWRRRCRRTASGSRPGSTTAR